MAYLVRFPKLGQRFAVVTFGSLGQTTHYHPEANGAYYVIGNPADVLPPPAPVPGVARW